jgi:hypothetical protein
MISKVLITSIALVASWVQPLTPPGRISTPVAKPIHHYVFFGMDREKLKDATFLDVPAFEGAQISYSWRQLEQGKDQYEFSLIREDLQLLQSHGKKLWVQLQEVSFNPNRINVPKYLLNDPKYNGGVDQQISDRKGDDDHPVREGWVARRWDPAVQERMYKLFAALAKEFDGRIAGINTDETSIGFGATGKLFPKGFTPEAYRDATIANMKELKRAFSRSIAMVYANFMPGGRTHLEAVYRAARESNIAVGGPDLLPFRPFQRANSYPLIRQSAGQVPTGLAVQDGNYGDIDPRTQKRATASELLKFATDELKLDYIFWCTQEPYFSSEVVPLMKNTK